MILDNVRIYQPYEGYHPEVIHHIEIHDGSIAGIHKGRYSSSNDQVIDGNGKTIMAGFNDSHMHLLRFGLLKKELDLTQVTSWKEMKEEVEKHYPEIEEEEWIFGKGFNDGQFTDIDHLLTAEDLDEINVNKYMYFMHQDGHECVISKKLLNKLEEEELFHKEPEDFKERDQDGGLTGRFKDTAVHYINHHLWERSLEEATEALETAMPYLLQYGVTSIHTDDRSFIGSYKSLWKAYTEAEKKGNLPIQAHLHHYIFDRQDLQSFIDSFDKRTGDGTDRVKVGAIKIFLDGTQRLHTAAMRQPYPGQPDSIGNLIYTQEQLNDMVALASQNGMQVAMHALGDRAVQSALTALDQEEANTKVLRHRIIHAQTMGEDLLKRTSNVGAYIETQPSFLMGEWSEKDQWVPESLLPYCDAFKKMQDYNIPITLSSDAPIGSLDPITSVFAAVNRTNTDHEPEGGWMPQERLSIDQSFYGFGVTPAELEFQEKRKGKIQEGYVADFVFLNTHPETIKNHELLNLMVEETWIQGKRVFSRE